MIERRTVITTPTRVFTTGTRPLLVRCEGNREWVLKHCDGQKHTMCNELLASRFAQNWGISTPDISLLVIPDEFLPSIEGYNFPKRFFSAPCFGSGYIRTCSEINKTMIPLFEKPTFRRKIHEKADFLLIALFDIWLSNEDRNHGNPNLMLNIGDNKAYHFVAFDHNSIFNSNSLRYGIYEINGDDTLINSEFTGFLFRKGKALVALINDLEEKFYLCVERCKDNLPDILSQIPPEWTINIEELEELLVNNIFSEEWIARCITAFRTFIQLYV